MGDCKTCIHNIDVNAAIYEVISDLEQLGELPDGSYFSIIEKVCSQAGCH